MASKEHPTLRSELDVEPSKVIILLIEDEGFVCDSIKSHLEDRDYKVYTSANGKEGLECFKDKSPDLVITDIRMPFMDGFSVLEELNQASPQTPVIIMSGAGHISDSIAALQLGAADFLLKPFEDISLVSLSVEKVLEKSRLQRENKAYQEQLEELVDSRTHELNEANVKLREVNASLSEFAQTIAHDLRSPLSNLMTCMRMISESKGALDGKNQQLLELSIRSGERMHNLISDILAYARHTRANFQLSQVDLNKVLQDVKEDFCHDLAQYDAEFEVNSLPSLIGSQTHLYQLFSNLLNNSLKYSQKNMKPVIQVTCFQGSDSQQDKTQIAPKMCTIVFEDNGIGFDDKNGQDIFQPFKRLAGRSEEGSGIGLATVKSIVCAHGGVIEAFSQLNKGTRFVIQMPLEQANFISPI
ncbi:MAG: hybrid sensor histidine kinase/response regulator [Planctomycetes bacterium]|nr:hybrid sensor histidine kinase/response regulator [Planctomycetota bacterium]